jgi:hypothetical protein
MEPLARSFTPSAETFPPFSREYTEYSTSCPTWIIKQEQSYIPIYSSFRIRIRIDLILLDPDLYQECGSGEQGNLPK